MQVEVVGAGLAGCEAAWQLAQRGVEVKLYEMRGLVNTAAHKTSDPAELVCSNSFRSDDPRSAIGLLHAEMRSLDSLILMAADEARVPAGSALAVDRVEFSKIIHKLISNHPKISLERKVISEIPDDHAIIATGPLTSPELAQKILTSLQLGEYLSFFDAISPILYKESIDFSKVWYQSRYDKGDGKDYINCPLDKEQYIQFIQDLIDAEKTEFKEWEKNTPYFNACLPIEVMALKGVETLRFGPMKPVGLTNTHQPDIKPYAVVQLRQDNKAGSLYNIVGFQTKMKYGEQKRVLRTIPGLENVEFARLGGIHRNTFINSPKVLDEYLSVKGKNKVKFAGQIIGVEGYVESAAMGLLAGIYKSHELQDKAITPVDEVTALGSLVKYITNEDYAGNFQPMNINFGLIPSIQLQKGEDKKEISAKRAMQQLQVWKNKYLQ